MCKYLINEVVLGKRSVGFECYSDETQDIVGMTAKQVKESLIDGKEVKGFKIYPSGEVKIDTEFCRNYMIKSGIGSLKPKFETDCITNIMYTAIKRSNKGIEVVSSRFFRGTMSEEKVTLLYEMGAVNGVYKDAQGKLRLIGEKEPAKETEKAAIGEKEPVKETTKAVKSTKK